MYILEYGFEGLDSYVAGVYSNEEDLNHAKNRLSAELLREGSDDEFWIHHSVFELNAYPKI